MRFLRTGAAAMAARLGRVATLGRGGGPRRATLPALLARSLERDALLLLRLPRDQARRLAAAAAAARRPPAATVAAAARFLSIDAILGDRIAVSRADREAPGGASRRETLGRLLAELALERTGVEGLAVLAAAELGPDGIGRCAPPLRDALIVKTIRETAASRRARAAPGAPSSLPDELCSRALRAIGAVLRADGARPLAAAPAPRATRAAAARAAIGDWRDLSAVLPLVEAGADAPAAWRAARDAAAFATVWTLPETLDALPSAEAERLRADADEAARRVLRSGREARAADAARVVLVSCASVVVA